MSSKIQSLAIMAVSDSNVTQVIIDFGSAEKHIEEHLYWCILSRCLNYLQFLDDKSILNTVEAMLGVARGEIQ